MPSRLRQALAGLTLTALLSTPVTSQQQRMNWPECLKYGAFELGRQHRDEPAETLVKAVISECRSFEQATIASFKASGIPESEALNSIESMKQSLHDDLIAEVLRGKRSSK